ncbi:MAG: hypothetical protein HFF09_07440 [Oscillospiraceae bacterium]|nr:hypothetical protein [Oscillospiraceae bacterium]
MKKRLLSLLLTTVMLLGLLPTGATAMLADHSHPICGAACAGHDETHDPVTFDKALTEDADGKVYIDGVAASVSANSYILPAGNYYLAGDITAIRGLEIESGTVNLCLNGHTFTGNAIYPNPGFSRPVIDVDADAKVNICDCGTTGTVYGNHTKNISTQGELCLYSGRVAGPRTGVYIQDGGTFRMHGGLVDTDDCLGVYVSDGTFVMDGGTVTGNSSGVEVEPNLSGQGRRGHHRQR